MLSIVYLSDIERGNKWPYLDTMVKLADAFKVEVYELLKPKNIPPPTVDAILTEYIEELTEILTKTFETMEKKALQSLTALRDEYLPNSFFVVPLPFLCRIFTNLWIKFRVCSAQPRLQSVLLDDERGSRESLLSHDRASRNKKGFNTPRLCRGRAPKAPGAGLCPAVLIPFILAVFMIKYE